jgi:MFS transporter, OFA family, oxalate/formate antiporter
VQPKLLVAIGAVLGIASLLIATNVDNFWAFWAFYCFGFSINTAWAYLVPIHHSWLWFPNNAGLASGICMGGYGLGAFVFDNIMTPVINPNNLAFTNPCYQGANYGCFPEAVNANFKKMFYTLIGVFAGLAIVGVLTIWQGPLSGYIERKNISLLTGSSPRIT